MKPLVPDDADLRGVPWMKLDTARLLESDFFAKASDAEFKAAITLWCKAWTQTPAGSLPNDDQILAHMCGINPAKWKKVKNRALHGWIECNDGRLYHPVIAEQVNVAWAKRKAYLAKQDASNERKQRERNLRQSLFARLREAGHVLKWDTPTAELRALADSMEQQEGTVAAPVTSQSEPCPAPVTEQSRGSHTPVTDQSHTCHRLKREESVGGEKRSSSKSKGKKIEREGLKGGVGENLARMDEAACSVPDPAPAPSAQPPSVCDGWIFAESAPVGPAPASDPAVLPESMPAPSVQASAPLFDDSLFADAEPAVSPEEAAAVDRLLFGKSPPPEPPPPAWNKPGKGKTGNTAPKATPAPLVQAEPLFDDWPFDDDKFTLTPEDEAEVKHILFGEPQPQPPPPPAGKKSRTAKTGVAAPKAATRAERATRIAENWTLSDQNRQWAKAKRPELDLDLEAEKFHNHWLGEGGQAARKVNWDATWRKWVMNAWGNPRASAGGDYSRHTPRRDPLEILAI